MGQSCENPLGQFEPGPLASESRKREIMGKKNPNLCERPYCRERWTVTVSAWRGYARFGRGQGWVLRLCDSHAAEYKTDAPLSEASHNEYIPKIMRENSGQKPVTD